MMENPFEDIRTLDLNLQPIETTALPVQAIENSTSDWKNTNPAAVSAHVNATRVLDFLFRILRRNSIDDNGMVVENVVNCTSNQAPSPPEWLNAVWWQGRMWYGQQAQPGGSLSSLSRFLDVIAHELFHGITEHTAELVYESQSGALNESMSDIFGIIIRNWHLAPAPGDVSTWSWEIGPGLGSGGNPLRSMDNPSSVGRWRRPDPAGGSQIVEGYPDHMDQYAILPVTQFYDWGGVHWFSSIHNFAAHKVLVSRRADNSVIFSPEEVAILYYLVLTRLTRLSDFHDARTELIVVSDTLYSGDNARMTEAREAINQAYDAVGIV
jgi:Zn-dependent metalloprotease